MDNFKNNFMVISEENEMLEINGGGRWATIIGVVGGVAAIVDYGYEFVNGVVKGYKDNIK